MINSYFLEQMVNLLHAPFHIWKYPNELVKILNVSDADTSVLKKSSDLFQKIEEEQSVDCPVIYTEKQGLIYAVFSGGMEGQDVLIAGPVTIGPLSQESLVHIRKSYKLETKSDYVPSVCYLDQFVSGILLVHWQLTGQQISVAQFWEKNKNYYEGIANIDKRISDAIFKRQEEHPGLHNPYDLELRELESIEHGDAEALARSISETYSGHIGKLAEDPLRSHKNVAVGNITLASRAAIRGGISVEKSFSMADSLIQQVEKIDNIPEVEAFKRESQYAYARLVREERSQNAENQNNKMNPLIGGVKDYIFSHLHDTIQVSDIAQFFNVNADYLSHLFRTYENMTISAYIRQEKIRRGQNLLMYSDYRIQDIAFYLGFCSQSHFSKIFHETVGMTPNAYRKKYGNRETWKIK